MSEPHPDDLERTRSLPIQPIADPGPEPMRIGRFEIRLELGGGTGSTVYLAYDPVLGRDVALKVPHPDVLTDDFRERFFREAQVAAGIHHPNVCPVSEVAPDGSYLVMRYVRGPTLAGLLDREGGTLPPRRAIDLVRKMASGVAAAHERGVIHRDLKPSNVLVDEETGEVLITDFGVALVGGAAEITSPGAIVGTPAYMAPEQATANRSQVGPATDVYGLGVILYRMVTGEEPFRGTLLEVITQVSNSEPLPPSALRPDLDPAFDAICLKAMAKRPGNRYASATALSEALAAYLRGEVAQPAPRVRDRLPRGPENACPRCSRLDTLREEKPAADRATPDGGDAADLELRCTRCEFRIRKSLLGLPRLRFPAIGAGACGKTHMVVTAYDRFQRRAAPTGAHIDPIRTESEPEAMNRFADLADMVLRQRGGIGTTGLDLPGPIFFLLRDGPAGDTTPSLFGLFDFPGETLTPGVDVNFLASVTARMDGYLIFLDPTQSHRGGSGGGLGRQLPALDEFFELTRRERGVAPARALPVPAAVCVPKFDLIAGRAEQVRELAGPPPQPGRMTLDAVRGRSELVERMLPQLFPGTNVRNFIRGHFGERMMFFPMSSVGLPGSESRGADPSPFGVTEPILWLLHMHGHPVFGDGG